MGKLFIIIIHTCFPIYLIHTNILAWRIRWTEKPGRLQSIRLHRVGHGWSDLVCMHAQHTHTHTYTHTCTHICTHIHTDIHSNLSVSIGGCFPICDAQVPHEWSSRVGPLHLWIQLTLGCGGPALCVCVCVYVCVCMCISWKVNESLLLNKNNNKLSNFSTGLTAERSLI